MDAPATRGRLSVVIPSHDRSALLRRCLRALAAQERLPEEVVVVADGCSDDTDAVQVQAWPFALRLIRLEPAQGPAAARNAGAAAASGDLLLFLDDDVEPGPALVGEMLAELAGRPHVVVTAPYWPAVQGRTAWVAAASRAWWFDRFSQMALPGHRFGYRDLFGGVLLIPAPLFRAVDGFDPEYGTGAAGEDYELGVRLLARGVQLAHAPRAPARHHEHRTEDPRRHLLRARQVGRGEVLLGRRHPALRPALRLAQPRACGLAGRAALAGSPAARVLAAAAQRLLSPLERLRARRSWRRLYRVLREYGYWCGVRDGLGGPAQLDAFLQALDGQLALPTELDLSAGLDTCERQLNRLRPRALRLTYDGLPVGELTDQPGCEAWAGRHLRALLLGRLRAPLLAAMAVADAGRAQPRLLNRGGAEGVGTGV